MNDLSSAELLQNRLLDEWSVFDWLFVVATFVDLKSAVASFVVVAVALSTFAPPY